MRNAWSMTLYMIGLTLGVILICYAGYKKSSVVAPPVVVAPQPKCPANDVIIFLNTALTYTCPAEGQQPTVVRQADYTSYIVCSCPK